MTTTTDPTVLLKSKDGVPRGNAKLFQYNEITDENRDSFHFHGTTDAFPITSVIAVAPDQRSADLLRGQFLSSGEMRQIIHPVEIIRGLTETIFRIEGAVHAGLTTMASATVLLITLVVLLSMRLRQRELETMFKLGCGRMTIAGLVASELIILALASVACTGALVWATSAYADDLLRWLIL